MSNSKINPPQQGNIMITQIVMLCGGNIDKFNEIYGP